MLQVKSMDEAIAWARRMGDALGEVEIDVGPVVGAVGPRRVAPKPSGEIPLRFAWRRPKPMPRSRPATPAAPERVGEAAHVARRNEAGRRATRERNAPKPSAKATRLRAMGGKHSVVDGPFAESKELIAGFSIIRVDSKAEAVAWTKRYADILGDIEVDIREVVEA